MPIHRFEIPESLLARARVAAAIEGLSVETFLKNVVHPEPVQFRPPEEWGTPQSPNATMRQMSSLLSTDLLDEVREEAARRRIMIREFAQTALEQKLAQFAAATSVNFETTHSYSSASASMFSVLLPKSLRDRINTAAKTGGIRIRQLFEQALAEEIQRGRVKTST